MYDQASVLRETVKWEYELRGALQTADVVDRALTIAMTEPRGPVYLTLPREVLAEEAAADPVPRPRVAVPTGASPDPAAVGQLADRLVEARFPVISALASGADPESVPLLADLCDRFAIGYVEEQARYLNLPSNHSLHLGYSLASLLGEADCWLFVENDVPWIPANGEPLDSAFVAQAGADPVFLSYPMRSHRCDLAIRSGATALFSALAEALEQRKQRIDPSRRERVAGRAEEQRRGTAELLQHRHRAGDEIHQPVIEGDTDQFVRGLRPIHHL